MTRNTLLLATAACLLSACAGPVRQPTSAIDAVEAAEIRRSKMQRDCRRPQLGMVCVREPRPYSEGECTCVEADRLHTLGIWPDPNRIASPPSE